MKAYLKYNENSVCGSVMSISWLKHRDYLVYNESELNESQYVCLAKELTTHNLKYIYILLNKVTLHNVYKNNRIHEMIQLALWTLTEM